MSEPCYFRRAIWLTLGLIAALTEKGETIFQDRLNHASLIDAGRFSEATMWRYAHNDIENLNKRLSRHTESCSMVITDGVFSMDGDEAKLNELAVVAEQNQSWLMVDDAHGFGVLGETGAGLVEQQQLN